MLKYDVLTRLSPGQGSSWHVSNSFPLPIQFSPPCAGAGSSHVLSRDLDPLAQDTLQLDHTDQTDQSPSTSIIKLNILINLSEMRMCC